jgi:hypothetical protein
MRPEDPWGERNDGDDEAEGEELEAEILRANRPIEDGPPGAVPDEAVSIVDDGVLDTEDELVGDAVDAPDRFAAPEEAAMSIRDHAPGATDHDDPHADDVDLDEDGT